MQQLWLESGVFGAGGADSWHPKSLCVSSCAFVTAGGPTMQKTCNKRAATAANAATLTVNWTIERIPMRNSQIQGSNINSTVPLGLLVLVQEFCPEFVKRILMALAGGHLCPPENL